MNRSPQEHEEFKDQVCERYVIGIERLMPLARPQHFLIENAVPRNGITFIAGQPGGAKSWGAYALALAVARRSPWLGRQFVDDDEATVGALVLNYDNPTPLMAQRFVQLGAESSDALVFMTAPISDPTWRAPKFDTDEGLDAIQAIVAKLRPKMVLIDSFRKCIAAEENNSKEVSAAIDGIKTLLALDATVVIIHHTAKGSEGMRGSGEIDASADAIIRFYEDPETEARMAKWRKTRGWDMPKNLVELEFRLADQMLPGSGKRTFLEVV